MAGLEGPSVGHPAQPAAQAGSPTAGCTAPRPGGSGISPEKETPQPPWAAWARVRHPQREEVLPRVQLELPISRPVPAWSASLLRRGFAVEDDV